MSDPVWEVFARKAREDRLQHVGSVHASDGALAAVYAWKIYDEERWFEMLVAPRAAFVSVNRAEAPFTLAPAASPHVDGDGR
ncbi:MAG: phenylacetic acid degradation b [Gemmatimonadota bacterium]